MGNPNLATFLRRAQKQGYCSCKELKRSKQGWYFFTSAPPLSEHADNRAWMYCRARLLDEAETKELRRGCKLRVLDPAQPHQPASSRQTHGQRDLDAVLGSPQSIALMSCLHHCFSSPTYKMLDDSSLVISPTWLKTWIETSLKIMVVQTCLHSSQNLLQQSLWELV